MQACMATPQPQSSPEQALTRVLLEIPAEAARKVIANNTNARTSLIFM
jgi:hypothetical protein